MEAEDRILFVNTFSKNWAMTGWRIGWLTLHPSLQQVFENLVQYSTSGVAPSCSAARSRRSTRATASWRTRSSGPRRARDRVAGRLVGTGKVRFSVPPGAFYLFFAVDGQPDSRQAAFDVDRRRRRGARPGDRLRRGRRRLPEAVLPPRLDMLEEAADRLASWIETKAAQPPDFGTSSGMMRSDLATAGRPAVAVGDAERVPGLDQRVAQARRSGRRHGTASA